MVMNVEALSTKKGVEFAKIFLIGKSMMIVDESTTIKNPQAKRTKNILSLSKEAKYRRILTGITCNTITYGSMVTDGFS